MRIEALTPAFGAVATGVDIDQLTDEAWRRVEAAFHDSGGLLVVRGQETHCANPRAVANFASRFGTLEDNAKYFQMGLANQLYPGIPEILCVGNALGDDSMMIKVDPTAELMWHCDDSFRDPQPLGSLFFCVEAPKEGAETWFASGTAAFEALSKQRQNELVSLAAVHDYNTLNEILRAENPSRPALTAEARQANPPILRPLVAEHPRTGHRSLYVPSVHIDRVVRLRRPGLTAPAAAEGTRAVVASVQRAADDVVNGRELVHELLKHTTAKEFCYAHTWRRGDCVIWDNRCTLHAPSAFDDNTERRLMWRYVLAFERGCSPLNASHVLTR